MNSMKRSMFLVAALCFAQAPRTEPPPVRLVVGPGKELTITVPRLAKDEIAEIAAVFFARNHEDKVTELQKAFKEATQITLVMTSK